MNMIPTKCKMCEKSMLVSQAALNRDEIGKYCVTCVPKLPKWFLDQYGIKVMENPKVKEEVAPGVKLSQYWSRYED